MSAPENESPGTSSPLGLVAEFYDRMHLTINHSPTVDLPDEEIRQIEVLLKEETDELRQALLDRDLTKISDGLGDVVYLVYGAALQFGIPLDDVIRTIHKANMMNSNEINKKSTAEKVLRGAAYVPPALKEKLDLDELRSLLNA